MTVRVAVIGCGWWATAAHLPALQRDRRAKIAALVDPDPDRLRIAAERFGVAETFSDVEAMLDTVELDAAVIAVPHVAHYGVAKATLERGLHTLLEKPMTIIPGEARELVSLAKAANRELIIGYPWHYNRQAGAIRAALDLARIGPIEQVSCLFASMARALYAGRPGSYREALGYKLNEPQASTYSDPRISGGGQGQTQVTHAIALLLWMTRLTVERVAAFTGRFGLDVDLVDAVAIRFAGGAVGSLGSTGSLIPGHQEVLEYRIFGPDGFVLFDVNRGAAEIHTPGAIESLEELGEAERYPDWAPAANLIDLALGVGENGSPGEIGLAAVEFVDAVYRSASEAGTGIELQLAT